MSDSVNMRSPRALDVMSGVVQRYIRHQMSQVCPLSSPFFAVIFVVECLAGEGRYEGHKIMARSRRDLKKSTRITLTVLRC